MSIKWRRPFGKLRAGVAATAKQQGRENAGEANYTRWPDPSTPLRFAQDDRGEKTLRSE